MQPRIYTYKITFEEVPYYYYGVHKENIFDEYYMGSPYTHKWCWEFYTPKKQILELFDFTDKGYIDAQEIEKKLIRPVYNNDKWCLNKSCGGKVSLDIARRVGKKMGNIQGPIRYETKTGIFAMTEDEWKENRSKGGKTSSKINQEQGKAIFGMSAEERRNASRKGGETNAKNKTGVCGLPKEKRIENGKKGGAISGKKTYENKTGLFSLNEEERKLASSKGGKVGSQKNKENKVGIFALTPEQLSENGKMGGKIGGKKAKELGLGVHGTTKEEIRQNASKAGKVGANIKWMCTETGYISNCGGLSSYQKKRSIDTSKRIKLEPTDY